MSPSTLFEKIWREHLVADLGDGDALVLVDRVFLHERTGGVALESLQEAGRALFAPAQAFCTMDHVVDTRPGRTDATPMPTGGAFIRATRAAAKRAGVQLFDLGDRRQGIVHVISPEQGVVLPGLTVVCPDSHTSTQGAFGALAWGIGSTEAEHALATSTLRVTKPATMRIRVDGRLGPGVSAKDLALHILAALSAGGAKGCVVEYAGEAVRALSMEARMTLCNMATELSAFGALVAPDRAALAYLKGRPFAPAGEAWDRAAAHWLTLRSDAHSVFDREAAFDAAEAAPSVTWGVSPQHAVPLTGSTPRFEEVAGRETRESYDRALAYMDLQPGQPLVGVPIDAAFIGSCTNGRLSDLQSAAAMLHGRRVAPGVRAICVPGSMSVKAEAEAQGLDQVFKAAGFEWREPGCSMCFFAGGESFGARLRVITSTNATSRAGRGQGFARTWPRRDGGGVGRRRPHRRPAGARRLMSAAAFVRLSAVAAPLVRPNVDTDAIIPSREIKAVSKRGLADGLFAGWRYTEVGGREPDPGFVLNDPAYAGAQILLGGVNFGCGSSREHAAWALAEYGFKVVIARRSIPSSRTTACATASCRSWPRSTASRPWPPASRRTRRP